MAVAPRGAPVGTGAGGGLGAHQPLSRALEPQASDLPCGQQLAVEKHAVPSVCVL